MKPVKTILGCAMFTTFLAMQLTHCEVRAQQPGIKRTDLQRYDLSAPGREVVHPGEEIIYVLEGLLEYQIDDKQPVTLKAGDVLFIPAGAIHTAKNVGLSNGAEIATYIVEKGKPLLVIAK